MTTPPRISTGNSLTMTADRPHPPTPSLGYRPGPLGRLGVAVTRHARLTTAVWLLVDRRSRRVRAPGRVRAVRGRVAGQRLRLRRRARARPGALRRQRLDRDPGRRALDRRAASPAGAGSEVLAERHRHAGAGPAHRRGGPAAARCDPEPGRHHRRAAGRARTPTPTRWSASPTTSRDRCRTSPRRVIQVNPTGASLLWSDFNEANLVGDAEVGAGLLAGHARDPGAGLRRARRRRAAADPHPGRTGRLGRLAGADQPRSCRSRSGR